MNEPENDDYTLTRTLARELILKPYRDCFFSERVVVRPVFPRDADQMKDFFMNPEAMKHFALGIPYSEEQVNTSFLRDAKNNTYSPKTSAWSILTHGGLAGCFWVLPHGASSFEIAYALRPAFTGRNLTVLAGKLILDTEFKISEADSSLYIFATVHPENKASQAVLKKLGLEPDPERQNILKVFKIPYKAQPRHYYHRIVDDSSSSSSGIQSDSLKRLKP
ncbi:MAG: GNAT family N-acetyltransferase; N-acetyltransferase [Gammaproteobacteria bacterium]